MPAKNWDKNDDHEFLIDLLFETNMPLSQIAKELDINVGQLNKKINAMGLTWIKDHHKKMSRGQSALTSIMKKLLPGEQIINEYHIGDRLKLDVYCPSYKIAAEYHGRQHFYYTQRFFDSKYDFEEAQKRDSKKLELCTQQGITLIVFRYNDLLTEQSVYDRIIDAIRSSEHIPKQNKTRSIKENPFYIKSKKKNSEKRKEYYKKMKDRKNKND